MESLNIEEVILTHYYTGKENCSEENIKVIKNKNNLPNVVKKNLSFSIKMRSMFPPMKFN